MRNLQLALTIFCILSLPNSYLVAQATFTYDEFCNRLAKVVTGAIPQPTVIATPASVGANQPSTIL